MMRGLTKEERHQWHGQPGNWRCKRCQLVVVDAQFDDRMCPSSINGRIDFARIYGTRGPSPEPAEPARPTRLDTPETVDKEPRQGGLASVYGSTGKGRHKAADQGGKR